MEEMSFFRSETPVACHLQSLHSVSLSVKMKVLNQKTPKKLSIYPKVEVGSREEYPWVCERLLWTCTFTYMKREYGHLIYVSFLNS